MEGKLTWPDSSSKTWSYSLSATQKMIDVTASKQWIHFFRSDRCPPTSNMLSRVEEIIRNRLALILWSRTVRAKKRMSVPQRKKIQRTVYWAVPYWTSFLKCLSSLIVPVTHLVRLVCSRQRLSYGLGWKSYNCQSKIEKQKVSVDETWVHNDNNLLLNDLVFDFITVFRPRTY